MAAGGDDVSALYGDLFDAMAAAETGTQRPVQARDAPAAAARPGGFWARAQGTPAPTHAPPSGPPQQPSQQHAEAHIKILNSRLQMAEQLNRNLQRQLQQQQMANPMAAMQSTQLPPAGFSQQPFPATQHAAAQPYPNSEVAAAIAARRKAEERFTELQRRFNFTAEELGQLREQARDREGALAEARRRARELEEERTALSRAAAQAEARATAAAQRQQREAAAAAAAAQHQQQPPPTPTPASSSPLLPPQRQRPTPPTTHERLLADAPQSLYWLASLSHADASMIEAGVEAAAAARDFLSSADANDLPSAELCTALSRLVVRAGAPAAEATPPSFCGSSTTSGQAATTSQPADATNKAVSHALILLASLLEHDATARRAALGTPNVIAVPHTPQQRELPPRFPASARIRPHGTARNADAIVSRDVRQPDAAMVPALVDALCTRLLPSDAASLAATLQCLYALLLHLASDDSPTSAHSLRAIDVIALRTLGISRSAAVPSRSATPTTSQAPQEEPFAHQGDGLPRLFASWADGHPSSTDHHIVIAAVDVLRLVMLASPVALAWEARLLVKEGHASILATLPHLLPPPPRIDERARASVQSVEPAKARSAIAPLLSRAAIAECFAALLRSGARACVTPLVFAYRTRGRADTPVAETGDGTDNAAPCTPQPPLQLPPALAAVPVSPDSVLHNDARTTTAPVNRYGLVSRLAQLCNEIAHSAIIAMQRHAALGARELACGGALGGMPGTDASFAIGGAYEDAAALYETLVPGAMAAAKRTAFPAATTPGLDDSNTEAPKPGSHAALVKSRAAVATSAAEATSLVLALTASLALLRALFVASGESAAESTAAFEDLMSTNEGHRVALEACTLAQRLGWGVLSDGAFAGADDEAACDAWWAPAEAYDSAAGALARLAGADLRGEVDTGIATACAGCARIGESLERRLEELIEPCN